MEDQRTSGTARNQPISDGVAMHLGRQVEDAIRNYPGGPEKAELAKSHPGFNEQLYDLLDKLSADLALRLPLMQRPTWKTLQRTCNDAKGYTADLKADGSRISDWAVNIMKKLTFKKGFDKSSVELQSATTKELTGKDAATTTEVFEAIRKAGGELCPAWVGPELSKQYTDQPLGEWRLVAMEPSHGFRRRSGAVLRRSR